MTRSYIFKRILWLFPAVWMVIVIAFVLKNAVPGDQVESVLLQRGISTQDLSRHQSSYRKIYMEENQHLPLFYLAFTPAHYPRNIREIINPERRKSTLDLLKKGYPYPDIHRFLDSCDHWKNKIIPREYEQTSAWQRLLNFDPNPEKLSDFLVSNSLFNRNEQEGIIYFLENMKATRILVSRPVFRWYGTSNQFHIYLSKVLSFDFGKSAVDGKPVIKKIGAALAWTVVMIFLSLCLLFMISVPLGLWSGRYEKSWLDKITEKISVLLYAVPVFWLASMLIIFFTSDQYGKWLHIFPSVGTWYTGINQGFWATLWRQGTHLILPVLCLTANDFAFLIRLIKVNTIAEKNMPYIKVAIARGIPERQILWGQVLPNVGVSLIAVLMGMIPAAFAGSLIVEVIFNIPGMGRLLYNSLLAADWNVVFAILILLSIVTILFNLAGDVLISRLNPKIRYGQS